MAPCDGCLFDFTIVVSGLEPGEKTVNVYRRGGSNSSTGQWDDLDLVGGTTVTVKEDAPNNNN